MRSVRPRAATKSNAIAYKHNRIDRQTHQVAVGKLSPVTTHSDRAEQPVAR